jgi:Spy/CpxP family protein refolding chaperone
MSLQRQIWLAVIVAIAMAGSGTVARCQEARELRPEVELLVQSVSEKLESAADALKLTPEQRTKIKAIGKSFEEKRTAVREQRRTQRQSDLKAIAEILTPEQREKAKANIEDRIEERPKREGPVNWQRDGSRRETLSQELQDSAEELALTPEQGTKIRTQLEGSRQKYREQRRARRDVIEAERKAIAEVLSPEQLEQAQEFIEEHVVCAECIQSVRDRLQAAASKLGLSEDQQKQIDKAHEAFEPKYEALRDQRRELMKAERKAVAEILSPEQREQVRDIFEDRVVVTRRDQDPNDPQTAAQLKETIGERLEAAADKLKLSAEQRKQIKEKTAAFKEKYTPQRSERETLRKEELAALASILTPEQREKVKDFVADHISRR